MSITKPGDENGATNENTNNIQDVVAEVVDAKETTSNLQSANVINASGSSAVTSLQSSQQIRDISANLTEEKRMQLQKEAKDMVEKAMHDGPQATQEKLKIKNLGKSTPQSKLMREKIGTIAGTLDKETNDTLTKLAIAKEELAAAHGKGFSGKKHKIMKLVSKLPFFGAKAQEAIRNVESFEDFIKTLEVSLDEAAKKMEDQITELQAQKLYLKEDHERLKESTFLALCVTKEIEDQIHSLQNQQQGTTDTMAVALVDEMQKGMLVPAMQKVTAMLERAALDGTIYQQSNVIESNANQLLIVLDKTKEVTVHALKLGMQNQVAAKTQQNIKDKIDDINKFTSDLILETTKNIGDQQINFAKSTMESSTDTEKIKEGMKIMQESLEKAQQIYKEGVPKMKTKIEEMQKLVEESNQRIAAIDATTNGFSS